MNSCHMLARLLCCLVAIFTTVGLHASEPAKQQKTTVKTADFPLVAILVNEAKQEVYILPPEAMATAPDASLGLRFLAGSALTSKSVVSIERLNSLETPLGERLGILMGQVGRRLGTVKYSTELASQMMRYIVNSYNSGKLLSPERSVWPPAGGFAISPLSKVQGVVAVFAFRSGEKGGILNSIDLTHLNNGSIVRSYWSRNLNDPTASERTGDALEKVISHFQKSLSQPKSGRAEGRLRISVDRLMSEKDISQIESIVKGFTPGTLEVPLAPIEVNRNEIRYQTSLDLAQSDPFIAKLKATVPTWNVRKVSNETGIVQIQSGTNSKESSTRE